MNNQLEALALLIEMSLPARYRVRVVGGRLYLFDPQGIPLHAPRDPAQIEAYAWRHAWRQIERELNTELADLHAGVRRLHSLRRLGQYMRMLNAVAQLPREEAERRVRRARVAWGALAASAAVLAAAFLIPPLKIAWVPESALHPAPSTQPVPTMTATQPAPAVPAAPRPSGTVGAAPTTDAGATSRGAARAKGTGPRRPPLAQYAVSVGAFVDRSPAVTMMHLVRSKGYVVYVARVREDYWIVTRSYRTRAQAERLVRALQEIGLPAQLASTRAI